MEKTIPILFFCTFNARSLVRADKLEEFEQCASLIKFDVIGLSEVWRRGYGRLDLASGHSLFFSGEKDRSRSGVGFYMTQAWASKVREFKPISPRIASLLIDIDGHRSIRLIQVYAPTTAHEDEEVEEFYEQLDDTMQGTATHTILMGDFNAKIGHRLANESSMGKYGRDVRNERGQILVDFCETRRFVIGNSLFKKADRRRWTWRSANGRDFNEIDFILCNHREIFSDVTVLNKFATGSDHRLVRAKVQVSGARIRLKQLLRWRTSRRPISRSIDAALYRHALDDFLQTTADDTQTGNLDCQYENLLESVCTAAKIASLDVPQQTKISAETRQLLLQRRELRRSGKNGIEFVEMSKTIRKRIQIDLEKWRLRIVNNAIASNKGLCKTRQQLANGTRPMIAVRLANGELRHDAQSLCNEVQLFFNAVYQNANPLPETRPIAEDQRLAPFLESEVRRALQKMKSGTAPGEDHVTVEMLKLASDMLIPLLCKLFNECLQQNRIPTGFADSKTILMFKKGDPHLISNYRPISLLSTIYKTFSRVLTNRLESILDSAQPVEQAGFRRGFSTADHIQTLNELLNKCREFHLPIYMLFIDFKMAFDSVEYNALFEALRQQGIPEQAIHLLHAINAGSQSTVHIGFEKTKIEVKRGVRQGDVASPKFFSAGLQKAFDDLDWEDKGIEIDGNRLSHLRFADDIVLISNDPDELQAMADELEQSTSPIGLKINPAKTKLLASEDLEQKFVVSGEQVEQVDKFIYLGHLIGDSTARNAEITRRISAGWGAFFKHKFIYSSRDTPMKHKRRLFNQCVLPAMLYGSETWALTLKEETRLAVSQRRMERIMVGVTLRNRKTNEWLRGATKVTDIVESYRKRKWNWGQRIAKMDEERWTRRVVEWQPRMGHRGRGRPVRRWRDDFKNIAGTNWFRVARNDEASWQGFGDAFVRKAEIV
jgi:hypothetical protein